MHLCTMYIHSVFIVFLTPDKLWKCFAWRNIKWSETTSCYVNGVCNDFNLTHDTAYRKQIFFAVQFHCLKYIVTPTRASAGHFSKSTVNMHSVQFWNTNNILQSPVRTVCNQYPSLIKIEISCNTISDFMSLFIEIFSKWPLRTSAHIAVIFSLQKCKGVI